MERGSKNYIEIWNDGYDIFATQGKEALWRYLEAMVECQVIDKNDMRVLNSDIIGTHAISCDTAAKWQ